MSCRICLDADGELLDCCACRGSVRFICRDCLLLQWEAQRSQACGLCRQAFRGRAQQVLLERMAQGLAAKGLAVKDLELLKQLVATATGLWQQGRLREAAEQFKEAIEGELFEQL